MTWTSETIMQAIGTHMLNKCITNDRLIELTGLSKIQVESSTMLLRHHGFIKVVDKGCYRITQSGITALNTGTSLRSGPKGGQQAPKVHRDSLRIRVWRAIRIRKIVSMPELLQIVTKGTEKDAESNVSKYIRALENSGYLIRMNKRQRGTAITSNGFARWRLDLERDSGPMAPVWRQGKDTVFDPNTGKEHELTRKSEVQP